ncbi:MAG: isochorismatase family protein [Tetrasphaera sp.]
MDASLPPPAAEELVVRKRGDDGFAGTDLESVLVKHGVHTVVLCGIQSEMCVAATARGAMQRGLSVVLPRDAHGTYPIPADHGGIAVPAAHVSRVAAWSLGDAVSAPASVSGIAFTRVVR